ncbi:hypothetical protein C8Q70DRAFT_1017835 [Cubamyces menziesii]|nr:hypothetical protein C8Q70DRAFT_1017835 [Cubamyces menziesii]
MLCGLPEELQIEILLLLNIGDIVSCKTVCRQTCATIDHSIVLRYKFELRAAGMVDTSRPPSLPISERLRKLRAYEESWFSAPMTFHPLLRAAVNDPGHCQDWWVPTGGTIPYTLGGALQLFRPLSASRGIQGKNWSFPPPLVEVEDVAAICVDLAQDLLVLSKWVEGQDG